MGAYDLEFRVALGEFDDVKRRGFAGLVAAGFEPLVLEDDHLISDCPLGDGIHISNVTPHLSLDLPNHHHGAVPHTPVQLLHTEFGESRG